MKGKMIVFEGTDCSFKETNSKALYNYIKENVTYKVKLFSFPNYESDSGELVTKYLKGDLGPLDTINPMMASFFYAYDRFKTLKIDNNIDQLLEDGYYIIVDRYVCSNMLYQSEFDGSSYNTTYEDFLFDLEYNKNKLPQPDITLAMVSDYEKIKEIRVNKEGKDLMECDERRMKLSVDAVWFFAMKYDWKIIPCTRTYIDFVSEEDENGNTIEKQVKRQEFESKDSIFNKIINTLLKNNII